MLGIYSFFRPLIFVADAGFSRAAELQEISPSLYSLSNSLSTLSTAWPVRMGSHTSEHRHDPVVSHGRGGTYHIHLHLHIYIHPQWNANIHPGQGNIAPDPTPLATLSQHVYPMSINLTRNWELDTLTPPSSVKVSTVTKAMVPIPPV